MNFFKSTINNSMKKMKHSGINPLKHAQDLNAKSYQYEIKKSRATQIKRHTMFLGQKT